MSTVTTAAQPAAEPPDPSTSASPGLCRISKGRRLTGEHAEQFTKDVIDAYKTMTILSICKETGRSYGAIHHLLNSNGVTMRPRGYQGRTSRSSADTS